MFANISNLEAMLLRNLLLDPSLLSAAFKPLIAAFQNIRAVYTAPSDNGRKDRNHGLTIGEGCVLARYTSHSLVMTRMASHSIKKDARRTEQSKLLHVSVLLKEIMRLPRRETKKGTHQLTEESFRNLIAHNRRYSSYQPTKCNRM